MRWHEQMSRDTQLACHWVKHPDPVVLSFIGVIAVGASVLRLAVVRVVRNGRRGLWGENGAGHGRSSASVSVRV